MVADKPDDITFRVTIVGTVKEVERLRDQVGNSGEYEATLFRAALTDVLLQSRKTFWSKDNSE
jgi:hypothetical protein